MSPTQSTSFETPSGLRIVRTSRAVHAEDAIAELTRTLDTQKGLLLRSAVQQPGRYARFDLGFCRPPLSIRARDRELELRADNGAGIAPLHAAHRCLQDAPYIEHLGDIKPDHSFDVTVLEGTRVFDEADRTRRPSVLSVLRSLLAAFASDADAHLGFYGAVGYDLVFQFEELSRRLPRDRADAALTLYLPDRILVVDREKGTAVEQRYRFELPGLDAREFAAPAAPRSPRRGPPAPTRNAPFQDMVREAKSAFARGDLFEVTPSQTFYKQCDDRPSVIFERLCARNPAPYGFLANLGECEFLIGASPEMFVRVQGRRVETSPIAGTIARGVDALDDANQIRLLLQSEKDEDELTMCTDVDRNDKARVCEPGSVKIIGRRQIELYSKLIHTVDHVEGRLRSDRDAVDAFLTHCWAVTVTGAPKLAAMQFIEDHEATPRGYYGGAVGVFGFDGHLNTGLVLRTIRLRGGQAEVRAGATLLYASDPEEECRETKLKASALLLALEPDPVQAHKQHRVSVGRSGKRVLLVDHQDSFVHTLSDYFRQMGAEIVTLRSGFPLSLLETVEPHLVVLSPGPGRPEDFGMDALLTRIAELGSPTFGVCLGLQAMVLHAGGELRYLDTPRHGNASTLELVQPRHPMFANLPQSARVGRYHSMCAATDSLPDSLQVLAKTTDDGQVMAIAHRKYPWTAVQFHPESLMSAEGRFGLRLIGNVLSQISECARRCAPGLDAHRRPGARRFT